MSEKEAERRDVQSRGKRGEEEEEEEELFWQNTHTEKQKEKKNSVGFQCNNTLSL